MIIGGPRLEEPIGAVQMATADAVELLSRQPITGRRTTSIEQLAKCATGGGGSMSSEALDLAFSDRGQVDVDGFARFVGARRRTGCGSGSS